VVGGSVVVGSSGGSVGGVVGGSAGGGNVGSVGNGGSGGSSIAARDTDALAMAGRVDALAATGINAKPAARPAPATIAARRVRRRVCRSWLVTRSVTCFVTPAS
jgi:hypothetical protein